ncbi:MAG TPA: DNA polymerase III subunit beta [Bacteroidales bacterium]|mgnify:FL=1|jgi:DNA polymerase-3 subunit beta|nr:DNA polymerase III subunit beta [Bacteroidales bacterium]HXK81169.1 DNA polymerase III subunit beta [Bacteroidales bacterium]
MDFVISSSSLLNRLQIVSRVISSKNTLAILDNFLFRISEGNLHITASDLESTLSASVPLDSVNGEGLIAMDAKRMLDILREFPEQPLSFNINETTLQVDINSENGKYSLVASNAEDFPQVPVLQSDNVSRLEIDPGVLFTGISSSIFAAANDELRPVMNGILMEITPDGMNFVATDAHKLVRYRRKDITSEEKTAFILPQKPAGILKNILPKADSEVVLEFDEKNAFFSFGDYQLICRLVEGVYPNYNAVIPVDNPNKLIVDRVEFYNTLKRVSIFSNQASSLVKLSITGNQLTISAQDIDYSISGYEMINCQYQGDEMSIGFKSPFLQDIMQNISTPEIVMELSDPTRAGIVLPKDNENSDEDILMLLMPMMINN